MITLTGFLVGIVSGFILGALSVIAYQVLQQRPSLPPKDGYIPVRGNGKRRAHYRKLNKQQEAEA